MNRNTKEFKDLQKEWYSKLKKSGFEDIEKNEIILKRSPVSDIAQNYNSTVYEAKVDYYRKAEHFLNEYKFESYNSRYIWKLHSEGLSVREISLTLKKNKIFKPKSTVQDLITRLRKEMFKICR